MNVGNKLHSSSSTPTDQCVYEISVTNSATYSSSALLSPTLSNTSSSSASTTPQQQYHPITSHEGVKIPTEPQSDEDILIKQMVERAMKLTQQGDTRHAQHLLGIIHEKLSNKRKRATETDLKKYSNSERVEISSSNDFSSASSVSNEGSEINNSKISPSDYEQSVNLRERMKFA